MFHPRPSHLYLGSKIQEYIKWNPGSGINPEPGRESTIENNQFLKEKLRILLFLIF